LQGARGSDVDPLVEFSQPVGPFEFIRLKQAVEQILEREVDVTPLLATPDALRESMRAGILEEAVDVTP
jgi:predicted nucleotidyltransferase